MGNLWHYLSKKKTPQQLVALANQCAVRVACWSASLRKARTVVSLTVPSLVVYAQSAQY